jgi:hypothetical protein
MSEEIICHGKTPDERSSYAMGYKLGMFEASKLLLKEAEKRGEVAGACPAGPYTDAANIIQSRMPTGEIVTKHTLR